MQNSLNTTRFPVLILLVSFVVFTGCARKMQFVNSSVVPAAKGSVKVTTDKNKNFAVKLKVTDLAPSNRLTPPRNEYVVWMETAQQGFINIGKLNTSTGFLSKKLKAELNTVTTYRPNSFLITAEDHPSPSYPSATVILRTNN